MRFEDRKDKKSSQVHMKKWCLDAPHTFSREVTNFILIKCSQGTVYIAKIPAEIRFDETPNFKVLLRNRFLRKIKKMLCKM